MFKITYIDDVQPGRYDEYKDICTSFVQSVSCSHPEMLNKQKVHLLLHLPDTLLQFGPICAYNTERFVDFTPDVNSQ